MYDSEKISLSLHKQKLRNMLINFKVKNYRSFKNTVVFNMQSGKSSRFSSHRSDPVGGISALRGALVFGPNAAGKTNLCNAIKLGQMILLRGMNHRNDRALSLRTYDPFRLGSKELLSQPTLFEYSIQVNNSNYRYGFIYDSVKIHEEWLYSTSKRTEKLIFSRNSKQDSPFDISGLFKLNKSEKNRNFLDFTVRSCPDDRLLMREFLNRPMKRELENIEPVIDVLDWFTKYLRVISLDEHYGAHIISNIANDDELRSAYCKILKRYDVDIDGIEFEQIDLTNFSLTHSFITDIVNDLSKDIAKKKEDLASLTEEELKSQDVDEFRIGGILNFNRDIYKVAMNLDGEVTINKLKIVHKVDHDSRVEHFDPNDESDGTNYIFDFLPLMIEMGTKEKTFVINEFGHSLHTLAAQRMINDFYDAALRCNSQFIANTHELYLMNQKIVRKDEIFFMSKTKEKSSNITRLDDFTVRFDKRVRDSYLNGDFDALPDLLEESLVLD